MRKRIYEILEVGEDDDIASRAYYLPGKYAIIPPVTADMKHILNKELIWQRK
ncbi:MAG: hypothetical protein J5966_03065 [Lachnospiraceae bacterium]|nr:hypothetical protein [Lachnospiraceae bacterium]